MDDWSAALVDARLAPVGDGRDAYPNDSLWADPDLAIAANWMRRFVCDGEPDLRHVPPPYGLQPPESQLGVMCARNLAARRRSHDSLPSTPRRSGDGTAPSSRRISDLPLIGSVLRRPQVGAGRARRLIAGIRLWGGAVATGNNTHTPAASRRRIGCRRRITTVIEHSQNHRRRRHDSAN